MSRIVDIKTTPTLKNAVVAFRNTHFQDRSVSRVSSWLIQQGLRNQVNVMDDYPQVEFISRKNKPAGQNIVRLQARLPHQAGMTFDKFSEALAGYGYSASLLAEILIRIGLQRHDPTYAQ